MGVEQGGGARGAREETRKKWRALAGLGARGAASAGLLWAMWTAGWMAAGEWQAGLGTEESLELAMNLDRRNGAHAVARARLLQNSIRGTEPGEVVKLWKAAVALSPRRAEWWAGLGGAYEWSGRTEEALRALEKARELFPRSPEVNWKLGNFYLRVGRHAQAQEALKRVVGDGSELRRGVFDLVWRAGYEEEAILETVVPDELSARMAYLSFLVETRRIQAAKQVWARLLADRVRVPQQEAFPYLDALIQEGEAEELRRAWRAVEEEVPAARPATTDTQNEITNGSFEQPIVNGGCDWRVLSADGVRVSLDTTEFFEGTRALRVEFNGKSNLAYSHVLQFVPVRPNTRYRLSAYLRAQGITSNSGPRVEIYDHGGRERLFLSTEDIGGTTSWAARRAEFRTGDKTHILVVRLARAARDTREEGKIAKCTRGNAATARENEAIQDAVAIKKHGWPHGPSEAGRSGGYGRPNKR